MGFLTIEDETGEIDAEFLDGLKGKGFPNMDSFLKHLRNESYDLCGLILVYSLRGKYLLRSKDGIETEAGR